MFLADPKSLGWDATAIGSIIVLDGSRRLEFLWPILVSD
jgi:hypothetical protein